MCENGSGFNDISFGVYVQLNIVVYLDQWEFFSFIKLSNKHKNIEKKTKNNLKQTLNLKEVVVMQAFGNSLILLCAWIGINKNPLLYSKDTV